MNPTDTTGTDTTGTDTTGTGSPVTIAEFLRQLRALSRPGAVDPTWDMTVERAAFLARKADLLARITAQHPDIAPTTTTTPTTPTTTGGGIA